MSYLAKIILSSHKTSAGACYALTFQSLLVRPEVNRLDKEQKVREEKKQGTSHVGTFLLSKSAPKGDAGSKCPLRYIKRLLEDARRRGLHR